MDRFWRWMKLAVLFFAAYLFYCLFHLYLSEQYLNILYITFDDWPTDYGEALRTSSAEIKDIVYDHSRFPDPSSNPQNIPPIIHFIWFHDLYETHVDVTLIPSSGSRAPEICRHHNPDFTINVWNASAARSLLEEHYAWFIPTYDAYEYPIERVDAFKYFVLWHYGGVYQDLDVSCRRNLTPLLGFPAWFPRASPLGVNNDLMAASRHNPIVGRMTESLQSHKRNLIYTYPTVYWSTGPQFTSDILREWLGTHKTNRYTRGTSKANADPEQFFVLPQEFYSEQYTFFGHTPGGTWHGQDVATVLWFVQRPWIIFLFGLVCIGLGVALMRRKQRRRRLRFHKEEQQ